MRTIQPALVLAALGALALAGCSEKTETTTTTTTTTTVAADPNAVVRKAGLWEQTTNAEGMGSATTKICLGDSVAPCAGATLVKTADGYTVKATCANPNGTLNIDGVAKGDLSTAYELTATISGAAAPELNRTTTTKLRYLGPCPEGMTAGQIQSTEGAVIDMSNFDPAKARALAEQSAAE